MVHFRTALDDCGRETLHLKDIIKMQTDKIDHPRGLTSTLTSKLIPALPVSSTLLPETPKNHFGNFGRGEEIIFDDWVATLVASSQSPRDRVLWILSESGGKLERSRLRSKAAMRYAQLNAILDQLVKEGRIRISGEIITVVNTT